MSISIDTRRAHAVRTFGDLTIIFTWVNDERAMVLLPTFRAGAPWFIVADSAAHRYTEPRYLAKQSATAVNVLGMQGQETRIATLILDHLVELVEMPSTQPPEKSRATYGEAKVLAEGELIGGEEVRLDVNQGAVYG